MGHQMWIYHKSEDARVINSDEFGSLKRKGWRDNPAKAEMARGQMGGLEPEEAEEDEKEPKEKKKRNK